MRTTLWACVLGLIVCGSAMAGDWDESVDGDLSNFSATPTPVTLDPGSNLFSGTIGGDPDPMIGDGWDIFTFTLPGDLSAAILEAYVVGGGNTSSGINFWEGSNAIDTFLGSTTMTVPGIGTDMAAAAGVSLTGGNTYTVDLREFGAPDQEYTLDFRVVPEPTSLTLCMLCSVLGMVTARRR